MKNIAIILSGGKGERLGAEIPKQFLIVAGRSCLEHTFLSFYHNKNIDEIIVVAIKSHFQQTKDLLSNYKEKPISFILGGENRNQSTFNAINYIKSNNIEEAKVIVQDGVRPLINNRIIDDCIEGLNNFNAVCVAIATIDTIIEKTPKNTIRNIPKRENLLQGQTPQGFKFSYLLQAYERAYLENKELDTFTDDCGLFLKYLPKEETYIIQGEYSNIKLTRAEDIVLIDRLFQLRRSQNQEED